MMSNELKTKKCPCWSCFEVLIICLPFFLLALTQNFQDLENNTCSHNHKADEASGGFKELLTNISALCLLQDLQKAYLHPCQTNYRFITFLRAG